MKWLWKQNVLYSSIIEAAAITIWNYIIDYFFSLFLFEPIGTTLTALWLANNVLSLSSFFQ